LLFHELPTGTDRKQQQQQQPPPPSPKPNPNFQELLSRALSLLPSTTETPQQKEEEEEEEATGNVHSLCILLDLP